MEIITTILLFIIVLSVLVLVHECGHFFAARIFGVHVEEFGLGFPPRARSWKRGGVIYSLNWLPLGGFVKLKGEQGESALDSDSFASKKIWQRIVILAAGVAMNIIAAVLILTAAFTVGMPSVVDEGDGSSAGRNQSIQIVQVFPSSPAEKAGVMPGDRLESIDGARFGRIEDIQGYVKTHGGQEMTVILGRGSRQVSRTIIPVSSDGDPPAIGVGLAHTALVAYPLHMAFVKAVKATGTLTLSIFSSLGAAVSRLAFDGFVGPVGIANYTATAAQLGLAYLFSIVAQLSVSLAVINILPIPALDGGRVLFACVEKLRGRSLRPALENAIHVVGFVILIVLLLAVTIRDITKLLPS